MVADITRVSELRRQGASDRQIKRATAGLIRLCTGSYAHPPASPEAEHLLRAHALVGRLTGVAASHTTAALAHDLPLSRDHLPTVQLSRMAARAGAAKSGSGYRLHARPLPPATVMTVGGLRCTEPVTTVLDCARMLDLDWGVVIAEAALHRGLVTREHLALGAESMRGLAGAGRARALPTLATDLSESPGESLARLRLVALDLVAEQQVVLASVPGTPRVDLLVEGWLVIEFDGRSKYELAGDAATAHWAEKQRHDRIVEAGYEVLRLRWADLWDLHRLRQRIDSARRRRRQRLGASA